MLVWLFQLAAPACLYRNPEFTTRDPWASLQEAVNKSLQNLHLLSAATQVWCLTPWCDAVAKNPRCHASDFAGGSCGRQGGALVPRVAGGRGWQGRKVQAGLGVSWGRAEPSATWESKTVCLWARSEGAKQGVEMTRLASSAWWEAWGINDHSLFLQGVWQSNGAFKHGPRQGISCAVVCSGYSWAPKAHPHPVKKKGVTLQWALKQPLQSATKAAALLSSEEVWFQAPESQTPARQHASNTETLPRSTAQPRCVCSLQSPTPACCAAQACTPNPLTAGVPHPTVSVVLRVLTTLCHSCQPLNIAVPTVSPGGCSTGFVFAWCRCSEMPLANQVLQGSPSTLEEWFVFSCSQFCEKKKHQNPPSPAWSWPSSVVKTPFSSTVENGRTCGF